MGKKILSSIILILILLGSTVYATDEQVEVPTAYDLRNEMTINVEYQKNGDQEKGAVCYHYAKTKMVESYIQKTKGISYNLSETYYAYGGKDKKYVLESDFPNKLYSQIPNIDEKIKVADEKAVIIDFEYLNKVKKTEENIKKYILSYGGVLTTPICDNQMDNYKGGMYHSKSSEVNRGTHAVVIIGWDDNYSKDNFYYEKPEKDGAWLVLNSWGSNWGNNGTAWVSYEDYYNLVGNAELIGSITLANGEKIETKLTDEKQGETKETKSDSNLEIIRKEAEQKVLERNRKRSMLTIAYIVTLILFIVVIVIKITRHRGKSNKEE